jgi:hypothetical protein
VADDVEGALTFLLDDVPLNIWLSCFAVVLTDAHDYHFEMRSGSPGVRASGGIARLLMLAVLVTLLLVQNVCAARSYYKIMGVDKEADERTIKRAYRVSSRVYSSCSSKRETDDVHCSTISETGTEATSRQAS